MPSPAPAADLERVLNRAAEECESVKAVWFGEGLPQSLRNALEAGGRVTESSSAEVAFVDASLTSTSQPPHRARHIVALSDKGLDDLSSLIEAAAGAAYPVARIVCPFAVLDLGKDGVRVREIKHGLTAADLQSRLSATLWSGPDLKELGTH